MNYNKERIMNVSAIAIFDLENTTSDDHVSRQELSSNYELYVHIVAGA